MLFEMAIAIGILEEIDTKIKLYIINPSVNYLGLCS
jgi:hypothetical protein